MPKADTCPGEEKILVIRMWLLALLCSFAVGAWAAETEANRASKAQLEAVRGVGPVLAGRILSERRKAEFSNWGDLIRRVQGVGPNTAERLSGHGLRVNGVAFEDDASGVAPARVDPGDAPPPARLRP